MGDIARCSLGRPEEYYNEELLYKLFGKNAELLIDHAWGWEPCTLQDIKTYRPRSSSLGFGQVLQHPYPADKARLIVWEMADLFAGMAEQGKEDQEDSLQQTILDIQARYGKNALLRGSNLLQGAMTRERNEQVGGHRA